MERDHPLALELASLRSQLSKYQHASHQSGIQLQGSRLEQTLSSERMKALEADNTRLTTEIEALRANPVVVTPSQESLALKQLSLAHRKLSALLDSTEGELNTRTAELVNCQAFLVRAQMETDDIKDAQAQQHSFNQELQDRLVQETTLRRQAEVDRDLCNSIVEQYQKLHPASSSVASPSDNGSAPSPKADLDGVPTIPLGDLFAGRPGLKRLLDDFAAETREIKAQLKLSEQTAMEATSRLSVEQKAAASERVLRADAVAELNRKMRDDRAAAGVVERYMSFSQTSSLALHTSLQNLRARHTATLSTLNGQLTALERRLGEEQIRGQALLRSLGQLGEEVGRESAGRRREIGLRLAALGREERILERLRRWEERAKGALRRTGGPPTTINGSTASSSQAPSPDLATTTLTQLLADAAQLLSSVAADGELSSAAAKIVLAEDLAAGLMEELRIETEARVGLEKERRELLGDSAMRPPKRSDGATEEKEAIEADLPAGDELDSTSAVPPSNGHPHSENGNSAQTSQIRSPSRDLAALPEPTATDTPLVHSLKTIASLHLPIQHSFHTLHLSLLSLQTTVSDPEPDPPISNQAILLSAVERLLDISEDARVELEIHLDDEIRVAGGFVALLEVGGPGVDKAEEEAVAFVDGRRGRTKVAEVFRRRLEDLEYDAAALKSAVHQPPLPTSPNPAAHFPHTSSSLSPLPSPSLQPTYINPLASLNLRNAMPHFTPPISKHASPHSAFRRPSFANLGRMFVSDSGSRRDEPNQGGSYQVGQMYRQARGSASALGLRGMAEKAEGEDEHLVGGDDEEADSADEVE